MRRLRRSKRILFSLTHRTNRLNLLFTYPPPQSFKVLFTKRYLTGWCANICRKLNLDPLITSKRFLFLFYSFHKSTKHLIIDDSHNETLSNTEKRLNIRHNSIDPDIFPLLRDANIQQVTNFLTPINKDVYFYSLFSFCNNYTRIILVSKICTFFLQPPWKENEENRIFGRVRMYLQLELSSAGKHSYISDIRK